MFSHTFKNMSRAVSQTQGLWAQGAVQRLAVQRHQDFSTRSHPPTYDKAQSMRHAKDTVRIKKKKDVWKKPVTQDQERWRPKWESQEMPSERKEKGASFKLTSE